MVSQTIEVLARQANNFVNRFEKGWKNEIFASIIKKLNLNEGIMLTYDIFENYERGAKVLICPMWGVSFVQRQTHCSIVEKTSFSLSLIIGKSMSPSRFRGNGNRADTMPGLLAQIIH